MTLADYVEIRLHREPPWQFEEDRIVGAMIRKLLAFEGGIYNEIVHRQMLGIVEMSKCEAARAGAPTDNVERVARHITLRIWPDWPWTGRWI